MILEVENLNKSFTHPWTMQKVPALKDVSFSIPEKAVVGFLGPNGAGKSTSIKCILGLLTYDSGVIRIFNKRSTDIKVRDQIGYLPERPFFYRYLSAEEFLRFYGQLSLRLKGIELEKRIDECLELVGLTHAKNNLINQFSKGMLQRIGMAQALIHKPKLIILDEPLSGLDPDGRIQLASVIKVANEQGATIFFSSHLLDDVEKICSDLIVIRKGVISYAGAKEQFISRGKRSFNLTYRKSDKMTTEIVENSQQIQKRIDEIRQQGGEILEIVQDRHSLEQAYKEFHKEDVNV